MLTKHKVFLLLAKWIPVVTAIGILINATLVYFNSPDAVNDLMSFTIGVSIQGLLLCILVVMLLIFVLGIELLLVIMPLLCY